VAFEELSQLRTVVTLSVLRAIEDGNRRLSGQKTKRNILIEVMEQCRKFKNEHVDRPLALFILDAFCDS